MMRIHNILLFFLVINTTVAHAAEHDSSIMSQQPLFLPKPVDINILGHVSAANVRMTSTGIVTGVSLYPPHYQGWTDTSLGIGAMTTKVSITLDIASITSYDVLYARINWWSYRNSPLSLIDVSFNNKIIASQHRVYSDHTFELKPDGCSNGCTIELKASSTESRSTYFETLTIGDKGVSNACINHDPTTEPTEHRISSVAEPDVGQVNRRIFQTKLNSSDWSGDLVAMSIDRDGNLLRNADGSEVVHWSAANELEPLHASGSRKIFTVNLQNKYLTALAGSTIHNTIPMEGYVLGMNRFSNYYYKNLLIRYWGGDRSYDTDHNYGFRPRSSLLGDIVNSVPMYVGPPDFPYPDNELCGTTSYSSFKNTHANRSPMIYVGANDGMVHGFSADTGVEAMAFIPSYRDMHDLVTPDYSHRYYVDASPSAVDACVGSTWKTLLIGGLGAGGRAIYALNVTDPATDFSANNILAWEFKRSTDHPDLGYTFGTPVITKLASGQWVAIFGNGYHNNSTGRAYLYVVNLQDGSLIKKIDTQMGTLTKPNGLSSVAAISTNNNHVAGFVYAGDLHGNLWKFDLTSSLSSDWKVAFKDPNNTPRPLFMGTPAKPITVTPSVMKHPNNGYLVSFGTGRYFEKDDHSYNNQTTQTFYAIWDGAPDKSTVAGKVSEDDLLEQRIVAETTLNNTTTRETTKYPIDWSIHSGWRMDLAVQTPKYGWMNNGVQPWQTGASVAQNHGERSITQADFSAGQVIFHTLIPGEKQCSVGRYTWNMSVDPYSGAGLNASSGIRNNGISLDTPLVVPCGDGQCDLMSDDSGFIYKSPSPLPVNEKKRKRLLWRHI